ncbi:putative hydrolase [Naematelia encephala]|uniref:Putative hydrolase n=1 Tax=Naematelia encephala TaxID=71784 RepID=A0A1Y2B0U9_9TREE|nr:putative hydrolase [Naematelia encephala]
MKFLSYRTQHHPDGIVGLLDGTGDNVTPLLFPNRRPVSSLHVLIEKWDEVSDKLLPGTPQEKVSDVEILAPLRGRDVLCVGKNYKDHAAEFHNSGYDSSDKKAQPDFPVIFTKRATSIVGTNQPIYPHPDVTDSLDYEGELGIIVGKGGIQISQENAWDHVWGAVIVNDFTARERQRDHKQFYIGKSLDTFCPMGPYAVHASALDFKKMELITKVNGEVRQKQMTSELIFDIPTLIETCSMGITLQPGDLIATGTPAGVCLSSGSFLKPGDKIDISITGLGTLSNTVGEASKSPPVCESITSSAALTVASPDPKLVKLPSGWIHLDTTGAESGDTIIFIHGLGGNSTNFAPLISASGVEKTYRVVTFDFEGHGLSPLSGDGLSIATIAESVKEVLDHVGAKTAVVVGHSAGGLVATTFAAEYPSRVTKLVLIGPVKQFPEAGFKALTGRAATVRETGMPGITPTVVSAGTSSTTQSSKPLAKGYVQASLLYTPAEGYAQTCVALANATDPAYEKISAPTLIIAGEEDKTSPKATIDFLQGKINGAKSETIQGVGHWIMVEDVEKTSELFSSFL